MVDNSEESRPLLLDLLSQQQTNGEPGLRLSFSPSLIEPLSLIHHPWHYIACTGNVQMALHAHRLGSLAYSKPVQVAEFSAAGVNGATPWHKTLAISPKEAALLAGHVTMAELLDNIGQGVPLQWCRQKHHLFPQPFRHQVRALMDALCSSSWFAALPGPARLAVVDMVASELSRRTVWGMVDEATWAACTCAQVASEVQAMCHQLLGLSCGGSQGRQLQGILPQYQFRVGGRRAASAHKSRWLMWLVKGLASVTLWTLAMRSRRDYRMIMVAYLAGAASGLSVPGASILLAQLLASL